MSATPPSEPWESQAFISPSRLTRMTHVALPGTVAGGAVNKSLSTLNPVFPTMIVTCTADGANFVKDQTYIRNSDNTGWKGISGGTHKHDDITEGSGGLLSEILRANQLKAFAITDTINPNVSMFTSEGTATPAVDEPAHANGSRIVISTGSATGGWRHLSRGGVKLSFGQPSQFVFKGNVSYTGLGNVTSFIGCGVSSVNDSQPTNALQYGLQVCDSSATERQWDMVNGNGTSRGIATTSQSVNHSDPRAYRLLYSPGSKCEFWSNNTLVGTNTNSLVASGTNSGIRNISFGVKTNTSTVRTLYCYGVSLIGVVGDGQWT